MLSLRKSEDRRHSKKVFFVLRSSIIEFSDFLRFSWRAWYSFSYCCRLASEFSCLQSDSAVCSRDLKLLAELRSEWCFARLKMKSRKSFGPSKSWIN